MIAGLKALAWQDIVLTNKRMSHTVVDMRCPVNKARMGFYKFLPVDIFFIIRLEENLASAYYK